MMLNTAVGAPADSALLSDAGLAIQWPADDLQDWTVAAADFANDRLANASRGHEHHADLAFANILNDLRHMGFLDLCADARLGGLGQGASALARVLESLCAVDASAGAAIYANAAAHLALVQAQVSDDVLRTHPQIAGAWLAWPAFHELQEQAWPLLSGQNSLTGEVAMLLLGAQARWAVLPARSPDSARLQLVLLDLEQALVTRSPAVRTLGLSACGVVDLSLSHAPCVPITGDAVVVLRSLQAPLASAVIAMQCGVMRGSLRTAQAYAMERYQGGGNLLGWGEVRRLLSLMHERLNAVRALLAQALNGQGGGVQGLGAQYAALQAGVAAVDLCTDGVQLLGGNGYMKDYGQEKRMRDARQIQGLLGGVAWRRQRLLSQALGI